MIKLLELTEKGLVDEKGESVDLKNLELKLACAISSNIGNVRDGKTEETILKLGNSINADYVLPILYEGNYAGGAVTISDLINLGSKLIINYYCKKQ